jgi:phage repressor protein C with HTH and peptisase S24 domain
VVTQPRLNAALANKSTGTFNNTLFSFPTIVGMHESAERLYRAAKELRQIEGQSNIARALNESPQTVRNWEIRGVSRGGAMKAQDVFGCHANWILNAAGSMALIPEPSSNAPLFAREEPWTEYQPVRAGKFHMVPVVGQGAGGHFRSACGPMGPSVGETGEYAEVASTDPHAFIVKVVGTSMVPKFTPGNTRSWSQALTRPRGRRAWCAWKAARR